ncbi:sulfatase family protein [Galbibacter marinus]|nr:sulfatase [Galbibacter marinus]
MNFIKCNIILFLFLMAFSSCAEREKKQIKSKPNIVFIMSDDHGYQAISAYNDQLIQTPNIDRIAKEGMLFTNASVTNSICAPSRAVILTGKHSHMNGKIDNLSAFDTTNVTFPQLLQKAGYQTAMFGKLHFGNNPKGFDEFKILPGQGSYYNPDFITNKGDTTVVGYVTDIITDLSIDWLDHRRDPEKPFLLMYLHKAPHRAWLPAQRYLQEFAGKTFPLPETLFDDYKRNTTGGVDISPYSLASQSAEMGIKKHMTLVYDNKIYTETLEDLGIKEPYMQSDPTERMNSEQRIAWKKTYDPINQAFKEAYPTMDDSTLTVWKYQRYLQDYLATIASVDENVGRLLDYLDKNQLSENTIVVYTSDQGFYLGEHGWFDKRFMYEESFKTPLLIKWPFKITPGITEDQMVQNLDFAQTFLEIAGVEAPKDMQGKSLVPILTGEDEHWDRDAVYYHYYEYPAEHSVKRHYGVATKEYKLIHFYYDIDQWELYDRINDPNELHNLYYDPAYSDVVEMMTTKLKEVRAKYKDSPENDQRFIESYNQKIENK